jgi:hypothetical protein
MEELYNKKFHNLYSLTAIMREIKKTSVGRQRHNREDTIKVGLREISCEDVA